MTERFTSRDLDGELMVHDAVTDSVYILSKTARMVYELSLAGKTTDQIVESIHASFVSKPGQDIGQDVSQCLADLRAKGLVE